MRDSATVKQNDRYASIYKWNVRADPSVTGHMCGFSERRYLTMRRCIYCNKTIVVIHRASVS